MRSRQWLVAAIGGLMLAVVLRHLGAAQAESVTPVAATMPLAVAPETVSMLELHSTIRKSHWQFQPSRVAKHSSSRSSIQPVQKATPTSPPQASLPAQPVADKPVVQASDPAQPAGTLIRVVIASVPLSIEVAASQQGSLTKANGTPQFALATNRAYRIELTQNGLTIDQQPIENGAWLEPGADGLLWIAGRWYRGRVQIVYGGSNLLAVNWIELEDYLSSVVGSEMPDNWSLEALKAQAVAARSYALAHVEHPASAWFDLGDDERWQAYRGIETESDHTEAAVDATLGQVLADSNGQILESLYASTEHLTRTAHYGIGMSQYGAQQLAVAGQPYQSILSHYYPAAGIAVLEDSNDPSS